MSPILQVCYEICSTVLTLITNVMEQIQTVVDNRKQRIALIESISILRKELNFPLIEAEEFDTMYDAPLWILHRYNEDLSAYKETLATNM